MSNRISIDVTFPDTKVTRSFKSIRRVARMLSGNGTASGGLRQNIEMKAANGMFYHRKFNVVRRNKVYG